MRASVTAAAFICLLVLAGAPHAQTPIYDLLIKNGRIVDGTSSPWYRADVSRLPHCRCVSAGTSS